MVTATHPLPPVTVHLLALPETTPATLYGLFELFAAVGTAWEACTGERTDARRMTPAIVAPTAAPLISPVGLPITPTAALDDLGPSDVVIVTDLALTPDVDPRGRWPAETAWLRRQHAAGALVCSVCTGSLALAEAGLLDALEATTHWSVAALFAAHYPAVKLQPARILCPAGPEHRLVTAGGASSWEELALHLVARFAGTAEAVRMAKLFVLGDRSEGQLPFAVLGRPRRHDDAAVARAQRWLADHYAEPHPVGAMARLSGLGERTFKRRFRAATGLAPVDYVLALRIEEAKQLLERDDASVDEIAAQVGYTDPAAFRRLFTRRVGVSPGRYRRRLRELVARTTAA